MKRLTYHDLEDKPHEVLSHTGLRVAEFERLLKPFSQRWQHYIRHYTLEGKVRKRLVKKERSNAM